MIAAKTLSLAAIVMTAAYVTSAHAEILIAAAGPFTGQNIFRGEQIQRGAEIAVADINARGGVLGQKVELMLAERCLAPSLLTHINIGSKESALKFSELVEGGRQSWH